MRHLLNYLVVTIIAFSALFPVFTQAQNEIANEAELVKQAQKHFDNKNYALALPLYSQIVSNQSDNSMNNYYLGVCLLKVDGNKADAVRFLTIATKSDEVPVNAWLYLGIALHQAYRFDEAIATLQIFRKNAGKQAWKDNDGDKLIQMCQNAINLNNDLSLLRHSIINEKETNCVDFVTGYKNISESGRFLKLPKEYGSKQSKDRQEASLLFLNAKGNMMVFAGPGKSGQTGFDIFKVTKDAKGLWMFPESISAAINSDGDEAYPVLVNDGKTIYFSSNGNRSTGGYDVFRSELNTVTGNWSEPVPMGSPVNSPANDFYYIPLADHKTAYFSSDRESPSGKCKVYTASVINDDRNFVTLNGTFICPAGLDLSDAKVTILNSGDRSLLAQFRTSSQNGNYFLRLPTPSKLIYQVKLLGFSDLESEVELNNISEVVLMQEILVKRDGKGRESVTITTKIPEAVPVMVAKNAAIANESFQTIVEKNSAAPARLAAEGSMSSTDASENTSVPLVSIVNAKSQEEPEAKSNKNVIEAAPESAMPLVAIVNTSEKQQPPAIAADPKAVTAVKEAEMPMVSIVNTKSQNEITASDDKKAVTATTEPVMPAVSIVNTQTQDIVAVSQDKNSVAVQSQNDLAAVSEKQTEVSNPELKKETGNQDLAKTNSAPPVTNVTAPSSNVVSEQVAVKENSSELTQSKSAVASAQVKTEKAEVPSAPEPAAVQPAVEHIAIVTIDSVLPVEAAPAQPVAATTQKRSLFGARSNKKSPSDKATQTAEVLPPAAAPVIQEEPKLHNVVFKVQLGAFRDRTEAEVKKKFEKTGIKDLEYIKNSEGFLVVVTGNESDYTTATEMKDSIIKKGISDAFVVVYSGDNRLPVSMVVFEEEE